MGPSLIIVIKFYSFKDGEVRNRQKFEYIYKILRLMLTQESKIYLVMVYFEYPILRHNIFASIRTH